MCASRMYANMPLVRGKPMLELRLHLRKRTSFQELVT